MLICIFCGRTVSFFSSLSFSKATLVTRQTRHAVWVALYTNFSVLCFPRLSQGQQPNQRQFKSTHVDGHHQSNVVGFDGRKIKEQRPQYKTTMRRRPARTGRQPRDQSGWPPPRQTARCIVVQARRHIENGGSKNTRRENT
jgi:hypothetical protein